MDNTTNLERLVYTVAQQAPDQDELWYVEARAEKSPSMIHIQADAKATFAEPGFRRLHVGFHMYPDCDELTRLACMEPPVADWRQPSDIFFGLAQKYQNKNALDAHVYIGHPETNNGLTVQIQPRNIAYILDINSQQANQIMGGRGTNCGHWKSGAKIHKMPESSIKFTTHVLDLLGIPSKSGDDYVKAKYIQKATTTWEHLLAVHDYARAEDRDFELTLHISKEQKYGKSLGHLGSLSLIRNYDHNYLGVSFGDHGDSSWDTRVPAIGQDKIGVMDKVLADMAGDNISGADWKIEHHCNGRDRGKKRSDEFRKSLPFPWRLIW